MGSIANSVVIPLRRARFLVIGDVAALTAFAILGRRSHDEASGLAAVGAVLETVLPFVLGWLVSAVALGALDSGRLTSVRGMLRRTGVAWVAAFPLVVLMRALLLGRFSPWSFYLVAFTVAFLMLIGWRLAFVLGRRRRAVRAGVHR